MTDLIRNWLIGITAAAMVAALADALAPDGTVKKIGKLAGGLLMIVAVVQPVIGIDLDVMSGILTEYRMEADVNSAALEVENQRLMKIIIEDEVGAYILDKAAELGIECTVEVDCYEGDDGNFYPAAVTVYGELTQAQATSMSRMIEGDLAIPAENQHYERTKER